MKKYKSKKEVQAEAMTYHQAGRAGLVRDYDENSKHQNGYRIVYSDGYESWSPRDVFDDGYDQIEEPTGKTLGNTCSNGATKNVRDIVFWGDGDLFKLVAKASSEKEGWMKSTKAMQCGSSVVIQVTTQQRNPDGSYSVAEALTTVQNVELVDLTVDGEVKERMVLEKGHIDKIKGKEDA